MFVTRQRRRRPLLFHISVERVKNRTRSQWHISETFDRGSGYGSSSALGAYLIAKFPRRYRRTNTGGVGNVRYIRGQDRTRWVISKPERVRYLVGRNQRWNSERFTTVPLYAGSGQKENEFGYVHANNPNDFKYIRVGKFGTFTGAFYAAALIIAANVNRRYDVALYVVG